ncbi:MAG: prenyltransferase/squalene oxidase repeat-containing protein, partial [Pirellulaceae bacterium]
MTDDDSKSPADDEARRRARAESRRQQLEQQKRQQLRRQQQAAARPTGDSPSKTPVVPGEGVAKEKRPSKLRPRHVPDPRLASLETDETEPTLLESLKDESRRAVPAYLGSLVVHLVLLIALALIVFQQATTTTLDLEFGFTEATPELAEFELDGLDNSDSSPPPLYDPNVLTIEPPRPEVPPLTIRPDAPEANDPIESLTLRAALTGRSLDDRERMLQEMGGTPGTEEAVKQGLEWLKRNQQRDGLWRLTGPFSDGTNLENRSAATAMALLCFLAAGHTHQSGEYQDVVSRGLEALLERQQFDGDFYRVDGNQIEIPQHHLYTHAQGMIVVCEALAMTGDEALIEPATKAVQFAEEYQTPEGGWRYTLGVDADLSVTGWFVLGLQSAKMAGIEIKPETWEGIDRFLYRCEHEDRIRFVYKRNLEPSLAMTAEGVLCRQYLGWKEHEPRMRDAIDYMNGNPINFDSIDYYYWYYATQVMHNVEGDAWK